MKTITAKIRHGKPELKWNFKTNDIEIIRNFYIYSPLLVNSGCDGKIDIPGTGTYYAATVYSHGGNNPAVGSHSISITTEPAEPSSDVGYNNHGSFLKIIVIN